MRLGNSNMLPAVVVTAAAAVVVAQGPRVPPGPYGGGGGGGSGCAIPGLMATCFAGVIVIGIVLGLLRFVVIAVAGLMRIQLRHRESFNDFWLGTGCIALLCWMAWVLYRIYLDR